MYGDCLRIVSKVSTLETRRGKDLSLACLRSVSEMPRSGHQPGQAYDVLEICLISVSEAFAT